MKEVAYAEQTERIPDPKQRETMLKLLEFGYDDFAKNYAVVRQCKGSINEIDEIIVKLV